MYTVEVHDAGGGTEEFTVATYEEALADLAEYARTNFDLYTESCWHEMALGEGQRALPVSIEALPTLGDAELVDKFFFHTPMSYTIVGPQQAQ